MSAVWTIWLLAIIATFAFFEGWALAHNKTTLSRLVWNVTKGWPPLPFVVGIIVGGLAVHFWWIGQDCTGLIN